MSKVDEDINNQVSEVPPKKRKTQEDKEIEKLRLNRQGEDLMLVAGDLFKNREPSVY